VTGVAQVTDSCTVHGEGPMWDGALGAVRWVDMLAGDILTMTPPVGQIDRHHVGSVAAAIRPRMGGGLVVGVERGFALIEPDGRVVDLPEVWADPAIRMNDGACDPQGRFYCGSMAYDESPGRGRLYRLDPDRTVAVVLADLTISNGLAWSPDGGLAYHVDSPTQSVRSYRFNAADGSFHDPQTVVTIDDADGTPDGIAVDADGGIWVALWDGGAVRRYSPTGRLEDVIVVPARRVTACAFGGDALTDLYITTSRVDVPAGEQPAAGALFKAEPGVAGLAAAGFSA
jgi:sugar lactone lactonase YvrE